MAIIFAVVGGGAVYGIATSDYSDHSDHSDYSDYDDYENYSDAAERRNRRISAKLAEIDDKTYEVNLYKTDTVNGYLKNQSLIETDGVSVSISAVKKDGNKSINEDETQDLEMDSGSLVDEINEIDQVIDKINQILEVHGRMKMMECINNFVDTMIREKSQFEQMQNEISRKEEDVAEVLDALETAEQEIISSLNQRIMQSNDENMQAIFTQTSQSLYETMSEVNGKIKETVKGMTFIQDFENHFTVSVFGKVKAGKSYIGNFIMGQPLRKYGIASSYDQLEDLKVHVYDRGRKYEQEGLSTLEEEENEFGVDMKEATSTIQWFDIGGLSWFDTPGIGSVTWENEMLAKEYVKNSDLVIFACNSDAAGTRQEFREIKQLYEMEKPLLLLLTQSDTCEYDVDEDGEEISILVPKSEKDRADTESYMMETLREQNMEEVLKYADILTVSAKLASEALINKEEELFVQSNMGKLLDKLTEITQNEAAEMKKNTPRTRINELIDAIQNDLSNVSMQISQTCAGIEESKTELIERKEWILEQIKSTVHMRVMELISRKKTEVEQNASVISEEELSAEIDEVVKTAIQQVCAEEAIGAMSKVKDFSIRLEGIGDMKMQQDQIAYEHISVTKVARPPQGLFEKAGSFFLKKTYYTSESRSETRYSKFDVGVNSNEIAQNIVFQLNSTFATTINDYIEYLTKGYYEPVEQLERKTIGEIEHAVEQLAMLRM